jgi:hypothetical protein
LGVLYPFMPDGAPLVAVGFLLVTLIYVILATGFAMHVPELFPTRYRMRGTAICATAGRITTAFVQFAVVAMLACLLGVLMMLAGVLVFQAFVFAIFGLETKGRTGGGVRSRQRRGTACERQKYSRSGRLAQAGAHGAYLITEPAVRFALPVAPVPVHHPVERSGSEGEFCHPKVVVH